MNRMHPGPLSSYRKILSLPHVKGVVAAGFISRLPVAMISLCLMLAISSTHQRYDLAGEAVAVFSMASTVTTPLIGGLADRYGQVRILAFLAVAFSVTMTVLAIAISNTSTIWPLLAAAVFSGAAMPVTGPLIRARWAQLCPDSSLLRAAYAWEAITDEVIYTAGPLLTVLLVTKFGSLTCLVAVLSCSVAGSLTLAMQRESQPVPAEFPKWPPFRAIRYPATSSVFWAMTFVGMIFGSTELATVAYASSLGARKWSGVLLALWSISSMASGLIYGGLRPSADLSRRLITALSAMTVTLIPYIFARGIVGIGGLMLISGAAISPTMATGMELVSRGVPAAQRTEALTWASAAIGLGLALGTLAAGWAVRLATPHVAYSLAPFFSLVALLGVIFSRHSLRRAGGTGHAR